jgi:hypothetical protein
MSMVDSTLEVLWKNVVDHWEDDAPHAVFLQHCQATEQLAEAAARYAGMRGDRDRSEAAKKRLEAVTVLATSSLIASRTEPRRALPSWLAAAALVVLGAAGGYVLLRALR